MGSTISAKKEAEADDKAKASLELLEDMMKNREQNADQDMMDKILTNKQVPAVIVVDSQSEYYVMDTDDPSGNISGIVDDFFKEDWQSGIKDAVSSAAKLFFGPSYIDQESEKTIYQLFFSENSLLRADCYMYRFDSETSGWAGKDVKGGAMFILKKTLVDSEKVDSDVLLNQISKYVKNDMDRNNMLEDIKNATDFTTKLFEELNKLAKYKEEDPGSVKEKLGKSHGRGLVPREIKTDVKK